MELIQVNAVRSFVRSFVRPLTFELTMVHSLWISYLFMNLSDSGTTGTVPTIHNESSKFKSLKSVRSSRVLNQDCLASTK